MQWLTCPPYTHSGAHTQGQEWHWVPWSTSHPGSGVALGTLDPPITALSHQTHPTAECISQGVLCVTQGMGMAPGAHPDHASPRVSHRRVRHPQQHLLPGEEPVPQSLEVHVRVGHDAGVEVHEVQALEPAWGEHSWGWGGSGVPGARSGAHPVPAAQLPGGPQHRGQVAQVHLHRGHLCGGVGGQEEVARGLALLLVAAGDAEMDAAILLQQPLAQRQPHAAATGWGQREPSPTWVSPALPSRPPGRVCPAGSLTRSHRSPVPHAP